MLRRKLWNNGKTKETRSEQEVSSYDSVDEIGYWGRDWRLHQYIIDNFWHDKDNDNLVDVFLTKSDLEKIVADGWGDEFADALKNWNDDYVVFYYPWY